MSRISDAGSVMETDIGYSEPSSRPFEGEAATSAEQWANWTTNEIRSAIEAEREYMEGLLAENKTNPRCGAQSGRPGLPASCQSPRSGNARRSSTKPLSSCMMVAFIKPFATPASRLTMKRIGNVVRLPGRDAKSLRHCGTFKEDSEYAAYDVIVLNGGSFLALHDKPGACPGPGWQLLAAPGKRGIAGERGPHGDRGPPGVAGPPGKDAATVVCWDIDRASYTVTPVMSDGTSGPPLNLRGLFEQFLDEVGSAVAHERSRLSL